MDFIPCTYVGERTLDGRRFDGLGRYTFANGDVYVGGMQDGQFHGQGVIFFRRTTNTGATLQDGSEGGSDNLKDFLNPPTSTSSPATDDGWSGQYRGIWEHGRHIEGQYVFQDGLVYGNENNTSASSGSGNSSNGPQHFSSAAWAYCHSGDRRLWAEYLENVAPVLPHEALLGGAKLLRARKQALAAAEPDGQEGKNGGEEAEAEGLPLVLPNAFVQARAAPAFATGQLRGVHDPRLTRWVAAVTADDDAAKQQNSYKPTATAPETVESTIALQLAISNSTESLRGQGSSVMCVTVMSEPATGEAEGSAEAKLNLSVCRVKNVEDVNRVLVQVAPAPSSQ